MLKEIWSCEGEVTEYAKLNALLVADGLGGLNEMFGIRTQFELEHSAPWVSYEYNRTILYQEVEQGEEDKQVIHMEEKRC